MKKYNSNELILAVDSHFGVYSPQTFVERYCDSIKDAKKQDIEDILSGPENEDYWEAWQHIESCTVTIDAKDYSIMQNEDIWLIPSNMEWPDLI